MKASIGDRIIVAGVHVGVVQRVGVVTGVEHADGTPPYTVRWLNDGHTTVFYPGPETRVEPAQHGPSH